MLRDLFRDTYIHKRDVAEARQEALEEERQARLQVQRKILLSIVQAHFPTLVTIAKKQAEQIQDVTLIEEIISGVGTAKTVKEARHALQGRNQTKQSDS